MTQREKNQAHLAKMKAQDAVWAKQFGRQSKYDDDCMAEGYDGGQQTGDGTSRRGEFSAFRQITGCNGVTDVIR